MRAKPCIIGSTLLLALTVAGAEYSFSTATASPAPAGHTSVPEWKSTPEDPSSWRREPIKSPIAPKRIPGQSLKQVSSGVSTELVLQGIMKSNKHYYAILNGRTVKPGDHMDGWTIAEISRYRVIIRRDKEKQIYDIYQGRIDRGTR